MWRSRQPTRFAVSRRMRCPSRRSFAPSTGLGFWSATRTVDRSSPKRQRAIRKTVVVDGGSHALMVSQTGEVIEDKRHPLAERSVTVGVEKFRPKRNRGMILDLAQTASKRSAPQSEQGACHCCENRRIKRCAGYLSTDTELSSPTRPAPTGRGRRPPRRDPRTGTACALRSARSHYLQARA